MQDTESVRRGRGAYDRDSRLAGRGRAAASCGVIDHPAVEERLGIDLVGRNPGPRIPGMSTQADSRSGPVRVGKR